MPGPQLKHDGVRERGHGGGGGGQRDQQRVHHLQRRAVLQVPAVLPLHYQKYLHYWLQYHNFDIDTLVFTYPILHSTATVVQGAGAEGEV